MKIGVVSDTHNNLSNCRKIVQLFNEAEVDKVIHTGDISQVKTLEVFTKLEANLFGVYGNNDVERDLLDAFVGKAGFHFVDPFLEVNWFNRNILVVHDPLDLEEKELSDYDLVLHGHTHRQVIEHRDDYVLFNPGECAGMMKGLNAVGLVDLEDIGIEILRF